MSADHDEAKRNEHELPTTEEPISVEPISAESNCAEQVIDEPREIQELRAAIGLNAEYYMHHWGMLDTYRPHGTGRPRGTERPRGTGFNWGAFIFSGLWMAFRKMYWAAILYYALFLGWAAFEELVLVRSWNMDMPSWLFSLIRLTPPAICGMLANRWYYRHIARLIDRAGEEKIDRDARLALLHQRGGSSVMAACSMALLFSIAAVTAIMVIGLIAPLPKAP